MCSIGRIVVPAGPAAGGADTCAKYRFSYTSQQEHGAGRRPVNTTVARFCRTCRAFPARRKRVATATTCRVEDIAVTNHAGHLEYGRQTGRTASSWNGLLAAFDSCQTRPEGACGVTQIQSARIGALR